MKITIISDNTIYKQGLKKEWGFSCLVETENSPPILFDTGASGSVLLYNMEKLKIDPKSIECVFISHNHWDHIGGLNDFLKINNKARLYLPEAKEPIKIYENIYLISMPMTGRSTTGELKGIEQSMVIKSDKGLVVLAGCSHPGVENILNAASNLRIGKQVFGKVIALIGGLHGFKKFDLVKNLDVICATHCTQHKEQIKNLYPKKFIEGGAGREIII